MIQLHTVHSGNNRTQVKDSTELNYYPNHWIFMWHIRLIPTNLPPKNIWLISADRPNIWIFQFFSKFFPPKFLRYSLFFGKKVFEQNFRYPERVKKNENCFGEQHNIKELSHKCFLSVHTKGTKNSIFSIFRVLQFRVFWGENSAFFCIIFFTFFHFSKENFPNLF